MTMLEAPNAPLLGALSAKLTVGVEGRCLVGCNPLHRFAVPLPQIALRAGGGF